MLFVEEYASTEWIVSCPYSWNPTFVPSCIKLTWSYSTLPSKEPPLASTLTNTLADLWPDIFVPIPPSVNTVPAAPPAIETAVVAILIKDPLRPVVGFVGAPGIVVLPQDTVSVDMPNFCVSIWYDHNTTL